jgi:hypothetical protein
MVKLLKKSSRHRDLCRSLLLMLKAAAFYYGCHLPINVIIICRRCDDYGGIEGAVQDFALRGRRVLGGIGGQIGR